MSNSETRCAAVQVRLRDELFERLEAWRGRQRKIPARADAMRQLLDRALAAEETAAA